MINVKQLTMPVIKLAAKKSKNKKLLWFVCCILIFNTIMGISYLILAPDPLPTFHSPSIGGVHVTAPNVAVSSGVLSGGGARGHGSMGYSASRSSYMAAQSYSAGGGGWRVLQLSDRRLRSIGGGGGASGGFSSGGGSRGGGPSLSGGGGGGCASMPSTSFVTLSSRRQLADAGAQEAPQMAEMASAPIRHAPGPPNPPGPLPEDHQLVEHTPLPDGMIALAVMALMYAFSRFFIEKRRKMCA